MRLSHIYIYVVIVHTYIDNVLWLKIYPFNIFVSREELNLQKKKVFFQQFPNMERENKFSASRGLHKKL